MNQNHVENFSAVICALRKRKIAAHFYIYNFDCLVQQDMCFDSIDGVTTIDVPVATKKPFYLMGSFLRLYYIFLVVRKLKSKSRRDFDILIHGGESAFLYALLSVLPKPKKIIGILDGFLFKDSSQALIKYKFVEFLRAILSKFKLQYFLPSTIGGNVTNKYVVLSKSIAETLVKRGFLGEIKVSNLPRHDYVTRKKNTKVKNVLYATTAFKWHNYKQFAENEILAIKKLVDYFSSRDDIEFRIRVHPRGELSAEEKKLFQHFMVHTSMENDLAWADVLLSAGSSISYEGILFGAKVAVWHPEYYGIDETYPIVRDLKMQLISNFMTLNDYLSTDFENEISIDLFDIGSIYDE